jgi:hypothetical protein
MARYEVFCHTCDVTFPPETKVCIHCGARTHAEPPRRRAFGSGYSFGSGHPRGHDLGSSLAQVDGLERPDTGPVSLAPNTEGLSFVVGEVHDDPKASSANALELAPESLEDGVEEGAGKRSLLRVGMSVLWMIVLAAGYAWRACSGPG